MKKWLLRILVVVVILLIAASVSARFFLSKDYLVLEIEDSINSRVQIGEMEVSLLRVPAKVTLKDVIVTTRDEAANEKQSYASRDNIDDGVLTLKAVSFQVSLWELVSKKIRVESFDLDGLHAQVTLNADGTNSLDPLFAEPEKVKKKKKSGDGFNAKDNEDFVTELKQVNITNVSCDLLIEKTGLLVKGSNGAVTLSDIRVNPNALEVVNQANLELTLQAKVYDGVEMLVEYAELGVDGSALTQLFDPETGEIDPHVQFDFQISESSYVSTEIPYVQDIWEKGKKLEKLGLNLGSLSEKAAFGRERKLAGTYKRGRVDLAADISVMVRDWEIAANQGSWLDSGSEQHEFFVDICASSKASGSALKHSQKLLRKLPREIRGEMAAKLNGDWLKNGKLTLELHTSQSLSAPKIRSITELPKVNNLMKDAAKKGALDFLLKKLK